ncbi:MAG TPA: DNA gyrase inhibitor YacG [Gammaproteobacteria bacterium]|nr:DNA gyrase inhibitor YacG [Gammaproteobacteria bacterium]
MKPADPHTTAAALVACPRCGKAVDWDASSACKPFCSERCRLIDLGGWLSEKHAIPGDASSAPEDKPD